MARTDLTATALVPNGSVVQPVAAAGNTDGHRITYPNTWPTKNLVESLVLRVTIANGTTTVTVKGGAKPPALESADRVFSLPIGTHILGPFTSGRHAQADGTLYVDLGTAANVTIAATQHLDAL